MPDAHPAPRAAIDAEPGDSPHSVRIPFLCLGVVLTVSVNALIPYTQHAARTISLVEGMIPMGVLMPFLLLVFVVNPLIQRIGRGLRMTTGELLAIFAVCYGSAHINELLGRVIATFAVMHYMASPENLWAEYVFNLVQPWMVVSEGGPALGWFYEGLPRGQGVPWGIWIQPLFWWLTFIGAIGVGCFALASIFRSQWADQERLPFPFASVAEQLADTSSDLRKSLRGSSLFWIGFWVPAAIVLWYTVGYFSPGLPVITLGIDAIWISLSRYIPLFIGRINFLIIGFAYFTDLQVLLSIWLFYILTSLQIGLSNRYGLAEGLDALAGTRQQALGGFIVFSLWSIWAARRHLVSVFRLLLYGPRPGDPSDRMELYSYRASAAAFLLSACYMIFWLGHGGMSPPLAVLVVIFWFVFYTGFTKVVAMTGLVFVESPALGLNILQLAPPASLSGGTIAMNQLVGSTYQNGKCFVMPGASHAARLAGAMRSENASRRIGVSLLIAFVVSLVASALVTIYLGYQDGAFNFGSYMFRVAAPRYYDTIVTEIRDVGGKTHYALRLAFILFGAISMAGLLLCSYRFPWWPVHPVGFTLVTYWSTSTAILSVFVTWTAKSLILHFGGIGLYRKVRPLFLGLIVGYTSALIVSMTVDLIWFPGQGHSLFWGD